MIKDRTAIGATHDDTFRVVLGDGVNRLIAPHGGETLAASSPMPS